MHNIVPSRVAIEGLLRVFWRKMILQCGRSTYLVQLIFAVITGIRYKVNANITKLAAYHMATKKQGNSWEIKIAVLCITMINEAHYKTNFHIV